MRLEDIGFYTLSEKRAKNASEASPLWRCEILLTDRCNFSCPYCRGLPMGLRGDLPTTAAAAVLRLWLEQGLKNVRFSGGEPTLYSGLADLVAQCRAGGVERIAVSTNGSAPLSTYRALLAAGVNDFSVSLDGCCSTTMNRMSGGNGQAWETVIGNIREMARETYVTAGMVFTDDNTEEACSAILFADSLGVSDIRIIPAAQYAKALQVLGNLPAEILQKYPILRYRVLGASTGQTVRGIMRNDSGRCRLVLDDIAVAGAWHFPCIIYLREGGAPIGRVGPQMRKERAEWSRTFEPKADPICRNMCLDVCREYNRVAAND